MNQKSIVLWFTGLPRSGKTTLAYATESKLKEMGHLTYVLDGDNIRMGLCSDLGFSEKDRKENIRRAGEVAKLFHSAKIITLGAFISPYKNDREYVRNLLPKDSFIEIFCNCPLEACIKRDDKGLYKKAQAGEIKMFTGISAPYEPPMNPELEIDTQFTSVEESVNYITSYAIKRLEQYEPAF